MEQNIFYVSSKCNVDDREFVVMSDFLLLLYQLILAGLINEEAPNQAKEGEERFLRRRTQY